jgi:hypothetical protein
MTRQEANRQIVEAIKDMVELYPDMRFHQLLQNMGVEQPVIDQWYEESDETLCNMKKGMKL